MLLTLTCSPLPHLSHQLCCVVLWYYLNTDARMPSFTTVACSTSKCAEQLRTSLADSLHFGTPSGWCRNCATICSVRKATEQNYRSLGHQARFESLWECMKSVCRERKQESRGKAWAFNHCHVFWCRFNCDIRLFFLIPSSNTRPTRLWGSADPAKAAAMERGRHTGLNNRYFARHGHVIKSIGYGIITCYMRAITGYGP